MKFNKRKFEAHHLKRNNPNHQGRLRTSGLESSSADQELGVLVGRSRT